MSAEAVQIVEIEEEKNVFRLNEETNDQRLAKPSRHSAIHESSENESPGTRQARGARDEARHLFLEEGLEKQEEPLLLRRRGGVTQWQGEGQGDRHRRAEGGHARGADARAGE